MRRREFIATTVGGGLIGFAGCGAPADEPEQSSVPFASVPTNRLNQLGWQQIATKSNSFTRQLAGGVVEVEVSQNTTIYEDIELRREVRKKTLGNFDTTLSNFFATRSDLNPDLDNLPFGVGLAEILDITKEQAKERFENQLKNSGLTNISSSPAGGFKVNTGETADLIEYNAEFEFDSITVPVTDQRSLRIPGDALAVKGWLAIWHHGDYILISGGAYPNEDYEETVTQNITQAITVTVQIDLGLQPDQYQNELFRLMRGVS